MPKVIVYAESCKYRENVTCCVVLPPIAYFDSALVPDKID